MMSSQRRNRRLVFSVILMQFGYLDFGGDFRSNWQKDTLLLTVCSFAQFGSAVVYVCCAFCVCSNHVVM